jgi:hypothetical protein
MTFIKVQDGDASALLSSTARQVLFVLGAPSTACPAASHRTSGYQKLMILDLSNERGVLLYLQEMMVVIP